MLRVKPNHLIYYLVCECVWSVGPPVNAVILCSCLLVPRRTLLLFFVLPMPAGVLAALFLANDVYGMLQGPQSSKIAHSAHLGGALFGAVWVGLRLFLR